MDDRSAPEHAASRVPSVDQWSTEATGMQIGPQCRFFLPLLDESVIVGIVMAVTEHARKV